MKAPKTILVNEPIVLFDASCLLYIHGANSNYERTIRDHIEGTLRALNTRYYIGVIDGKRNFRYDVATIAPYKGTRDKSDILEKFPYFYEVKRGLLEVYGFKTVNGIEADDVVSIYNERLKALEMFIEVYETEDDEVPTVVLFPPSSFSCVVATIDKDLLQLTGLHYNLSKHTLMLSTDETSYIELNVTRTKIEGCGFMFFYAQILIGDTVDNIKGLEKCGPVKAYELLKNCNTAEECEKIVIEAFVNKEIELNKNLDVTEQRTIDEVTRIAFFKYAETRNLVYMLRRNRNLPSMEVTAYQF